MCFDEAPRLTPRGDSPHHGLPRRASAEGPLASLGVTERGGSRRHPCFVLPRGSEASLVLLGTASFLTSFGTASTPHPVFSNVSEKSPPCGRERLKGRPLTSFGVTRKKGLGKTKGEIPRLTPRGDRKKQGCSVHLVRPIMQLVQFCSLLKQLDYRLNSRDSKELEP